MYKIRLTDRKGYTQVKEYDDDYFAFMWEEGNFSCDCNRSRFLYGDEDAKCNNGENQIEAALIIDKNNDIRGPA